jgi:hypothetical protein
MVEFEGFGFDAEVPYLEELAIDEEDDFEKEGIFIFFFEHYSFMVDGHHGGGFVVVLHL